MAEYIDREALLEKRWDVPFETEDSHFVQVVDVGDIIAAPAADVAPARHGRWVNDHGYIGCSCCMTGVERRMEDGITEWVDLSGMPFCPSCGAKMDGGDQDA